VNRTISERVNQAASQIVNQTAAQILQDVNRTISERVNQTASQIVNQTAAQILQDVNRNISATAKVATQTAKQAGADAGKQAASDILPKSIQDMLLLVFLIIAIPLILNLVLVSVRKKPRESTDFYRALMTFGLILIVGLLVFYLIAIISTNISSSNVASSNVTSSNVTKQANDNLDAVINIVQNLAAILGTALASVIAFYFGLRASAAQNASSETGGPPTTGGPSTSNTKDNV
jgi:hypothetical protein